MKGHIRERPGGVLEVIVYIGRDAMGKPRYKSKRTREGKRAAQRLLTQMLAEVQSGGLRPPSAESLGEYLEQWLVTTGALRLSPKSLQTFGSVFRKQVIPALGDIKLNRLTAQDVERWLVALMAPGGRRDGRAGGVSPQSAAYYLTLLRIALNDAVRHGRLRQNPCKAIMLPKAAVPDVEVLTESEIRKLIKATRGRMRMAIILGAGLGLRRGEVSGLKWSDVDFEAAMVTIRRSVEDTKAHGLRFKLPKSGKPRTVPLPEFVARELVRWRGEQAQIRLLTADYKDNDLICCRPDGTIWPPNCISRNFRYIAERLSLPMRFHALRHTYATTLLGGGANHKIVQEALGHHSPAFTLAKYGHVLPEHLMAAARILDQAIGE